MPRFPNTEPEIIALAQLQIDGLIKNDASFPEMPFKSNEVQALLADFLVKRSEANDSAAAAKLDTMEKEDSLELLISALKDNFKHAEILHKKNDAMLQKIGWSARANRTALQKPEQPRTLEAPKQGDGWLFLDWKEPLEGGLPSQYKVWRRELPDGAPQLADSPIPSECTLVNQPRKVELEFYVIAVNRSGESAQSNTVTVVL